MIQKEKSIKIAFIIWSLADMGGSERVVYDVVRKIDKKHFSPIIISFEDGLARELYEKIGVRTISIKRDKKIDLEFVRSEINKSVSELLANSDGREVDPDKAIDWFFDSIKPHVLSGVIKVDVQI